MFETFTQQALNREAGAVYVPLVFGLSIVFMLLSLSARRKKGT
jgi:hypothetical protein